MCPKKGCKISRAQLGDQRCGVNLAELTLEGVVCEVNATLPHQFIAEGFNQEDQYFQYGLITWQQGKNSGLSMEIQSFQSAQWPHQNAEDIMKGIFQLVQPMPYPIEVGDIFFVTPGCNKTLRMCKARFNNVMNFRGEPFIPGMDRMLKVP